MSELAAVENKTITTPVVTPMSILEQSSNVDPERAAVLFELQLKWEANQARKAYHSAMAAFKANPPKLEKTKHVKYGNTEYWHQDLGGSMDAINGALAEHDLSVGWRTDQSDGSIKVECVCCHVDGHSESTSMTAPADNSGAKNNIQAIASTVTYLQRYTANALLGLAAVDKDTDARTPADLVTLEQAASIRERLEAMERDEVKFCQWLKVESIEAIPLIVYGRAIQAIEKAEKEHADS